jgi:hypothetical protein
MLTSGDMAVMEVEMEGAWFNAADLSCATAETIEEEVMS